MDVGVIGLGAMGLPMAQTLQGRGFAVHGFDADPARRKMLGDRAVETAQALAGAPAVLLSLPNDAIVADVVRGLLAQMVVGAVIIDTSTVAPATTRQLSAEATRRGIGYVDAPVSGGAAGAAAGSLLVMCGGTQEARDAARPVLTAIARKIVDCGGPGSGNVVKLVNNMLCAGHLLLASEALRMVAAANVRPEDALAAINAGSGRSAVTEVNLPRWVLSGTFDSAFSMGLMTKDVSLAAALEGAGTQSAQLAREWQEATGLLGAGADFNRIVTARDRQEDA